jgi:hypothetical protein
MKTFSMSLAENEAAILRDALMDAAIALRTNPRTEVVIAEDVFLNNPEISQARKDRYEVLAGYADELADFVRLA